jgi:hypothetical protein
MANPARSAPGFCVLRCGMKMARAGLAERRTVAIWFAGALSISCLGKYRGKPFPINGVAR